MKQYINPPKSEWKTLSERAADESIGISKKVESIFSDVAVRGDTALYELTQRYDGASINAIELSMKQVQVLAQEAKSDIKRAIDSAYENITIFHKSQTLDRKKIETAPGVICWQEVRAIERVGIYVPGGSAPLVSTVLMLGVPAQLAGCREVIMATPPNGSGLIDPALFYAAVKCGVTRIMTIGGAQAIAALCVGTKSVPRVDKIFGPGNQFVTQAKLQAYRYGVAIDIPAGPSEVCVFADDSAVPSFVAADLLSQAEHGPDSQAMLVSTSKDMIPKIMKEISRQLPLLSRCTIAETALGFSSAVYFDDKNNAIDFINQYAPEHLILSVKNSRDVACAVVNAGSVFIGNYSPESAGDYASGTNHTLPTAGWASSCGGVSLASFQKQITFQELTEDGLASLAPTITALANVEGLDAHARAVTIRSREA